MPKGYIIAHVTVHDAEAYQAYIDGNSAIIARNGGRILVRGGASETVEGESKQRHVVFEFESYDAARAAYFDPDYQEIAKIRKANADSTIILVEGA